MYSVTKRVLDLTGAILGLLALSPILAAVAIIVRTRLGRPVLFRQLRPGLHGRPFTLYKFRTMRDLFDEQGNPLPDEQRLPPVGRFLRRNSLDVLPELINVLRGDMSLVGPRPLMLAYLDRYTKAQARRHEVIPGLTGWAQVNGRNALTWEQKFALDVWYVEHRSFWLDLKILALTVRISLKREGVTQPGHMTVEEFMGDPAQQALETSRLDGQIDLAREALPKDAM
jgi:sugar transferase EpsL